MKLNLSDKEAKFILWATMCTDGFLDFENNTEESFKQYYGFTMEEVDEIKNKFQSEIRRIKPNLNLTS